jgi:hypothetical protein
LHCTNTEKLFPFEPLAPKTFGLAGRKRKANLCATMSKQTEKGEEMTVRLRPEEVGYLQGLLREHLEYYGCFVHRLPSKCTPRNREIYELVSGLWSKLQTADNTLKAQQAESRPVTAAGAERGNGRSGRR